MARGSIVFLLTSVFLIGGFFIFIPRILAAENDVQITEIMYDPDGSDTKNEWLEIKNTGAGAIEIIGGAGAMSWRLFDGNNHTFSTSTTLLAGEYCAVAQDETTFLSNYPGYTGQILKSSFSLTNFSGTVALRIDSDGAPWSEVDYDKSWGGSGNGKTLEKKDEAGSGALANWQESYVVGGTPGAVKSEASTTSSTLPEIPPEATTSTLHATSTLEIIEIKINEIYPVTVSSSEKEWVELFNPASSAVDLSGWFLLDNSSTTTLEGEIASGGFLVVEFSSRLNNSGDILILKDSDEEIIDQMAYGDFAADNLAAPEAGESLARSPNGQDTGNDQNDFFLTTTPTKQTDNVISKPAAVGGSSGSGSSDNSDTSLKTIKTDDDTASVVILSAREKQIVISELLPNPKGSDTQKEMIELKNISSKEINLSGWFLIGSNKHKYYFSSSTIMTPGSFLVVDRIQTKISLKNSGGDFLELYNPAKQLSDKAVYSESAAEDASFARTTSTADLWSWTIKPTFGEENIIVPPNYPPEVFFNLPGILMVDEEGNFEAGDTFDPDDDNLRFLWNLDGNLLEGEGVIFSFGTPGKKKVILTVDDNHGHVITKKATVQVEGETEATEKTTTATKINKTKNKIRQTVSLAEVKNLAIGDLIKIQGVVVVLPGIFSTQMFFIVDEVSGAGVPVYMYSKDFPEIKNGDKVEVSGELGSYLGTVRVKTKNKSDIDILSTANPVDLLILNIGDIDEDKFFSSVQIEGEVLESGSGYFYLGDEQGEIKVQTKSKTGLKGKIAGVGDKVKVAGIIGKSKDEWVLWPRGVEDIQILEVGAPVEKEAAKEVTEKYLTATAGGVTSLLLALLAKGRGAVAKALAFGFIGKVAFWKKKDDV